jgi:hypothetical protein
MCDVCNPPRVEPKPRLRVEPVETPAASNGHLALTLVVPAIRGMQRAHPAHS